VKYLVIWFWLNSVMVPCPQPEMVADEYGRIPKMTSMTLQSCFETYRVRQERVFATEDEALRFIRIGEEKDDVVDFTIEETM